MGTEADMIRAGRALLGLHEQPMGSNYVPRVTKWYNAKFHLGTVKFSWCDASITEESYASGNQDAVCGGGGFAYVPAHAQWFRSKGRFHTGTRGIRPGDVVFYNWSRRRGTTLCDHVGLVEKVFSDGSFYALEGNHNDQFERVHRDATYVSGYGRPDYAQEENDVQLNDNVPVPGWAKAEWKSDKGIQDGIHVSTALGYTYAWARSARAGTDALRRQLAAMQAKDAARDAVLGKLVDQLGALAGATKPDLEALKTEIQAAIKDAVDSISVQASVDDTTDSGAS